ncbi:hypothetical protein M0813_18094 [Anaeramoeba flamelloides]|uniref:Uncharacterized protein n=1 Tax=Anaeramoeba flamelloides TaxID=1746091 RepID=A0ABQ8YTQ2_9EUKA|nr:hypothetical protein M0813_18094 [Anaeramoeba flamelloides]
MSRRRKKKSQFSGLKREETSFDPLSNPNPEKKKTKKKSNVPKKKIIARQKFTYEEEPEENIFTISENKNTKKQEEEEDIFFKETDSSLLNVGSSNVDEILEKEIDQNIKPKETKKKHQHRSLKQK